MNTSDILSEASLRRIAKRTRLARSAAAASTDSGGCQLLADVILTLERHPVWSRTGLSLLLADFGFACMREVKNNP